MNFSLFYIFFTFITIYMVQPMVAEMEEQCLMPKLVKINDSRLYFGTSLKLNWFNAYQFCRYHDMQLLTLQSPEQLRSIIQHINSSVYTDFSYWTSGNDLGTYGKYTWMTTGDRIDTKSSLWGRNQPDNYKSSEHCLSLYQYQGFMLNDHQCLYNFYFICETINDLNY